MRLTESALEAEALLAAVRRDEDGAVVSFVGVVRNHHKGRAVERIVYEAYRPMAEKEIESVIASVERDVAGVKVELRHRLGSLEVGDASVVIAAAAAHRVDAFEACRLALERLKSTVPIWKRELGPEGESWVGWQWD